MIYKHTKNGGFSLVEVLVAITILLLVLAGPMRILTSTTNSTTFSSEQVVATFLAQEGLELVELGRDNLVLDDFKDKIQDTSDAPNPWAQFQTDFAACIDGLPNNDAYVCGLSPQANSPGYTITDCGMNLAHPNCRLYIGAPEALYKYTHSAAAGNTETIYIRTVRIGLIPGGGANAQGLVATSTVTWRTGSLVADQKVELVTYLTNVYDTP